EKSYVILHIYLTGRGSAKTWWIFASSEANLARIHHRSEVSAQTWWILALQTARIHSSPNGPKTNPL
ncbi:hypothetical protein J433_10667, partial [Corynebacterium glutamicum MT]